MSNRPIIGNTVGTPISVSEIERKIKPVKTVNSVVPDENGNVDTPDRYVVSASTEFVRMPNSTSFIYKIVLEMSNGETVEVELPSIPASAITPEDYIILSNEDPTMDTEGYTAQLLVNTVTAKIWVCTSGDTPGMKVYPYKWLNVAGGDGESTDGGSVVPEPTQDNEGAFLTVRDGKASWEQLPKYDGEYEVTPSAAYDQQLKTGQKYVDANITVRKIPYAEVTNTSNGITVTIGNEV